MHNILTSILALALCTGASSATARFRLYRSTDDGRSWTEAGHGIPADLRTDSLGESGSMRLAGTERGLFISADDGKTWTRPSRGIPESIKVMDFTVNNGRVYGATTRGVWMSADDGTSWAPMGVELAEVKVLSLTAANGYVLAGTDQRGAWALSGSSTNWEQVATGLPARPQMFQFAVQGGTVFAALYAQGVYRLDSVRKEWTPTAEERPLRLVSSGGMLFAGRNPGGVFMSSDHGVSWQSASAGLPPHAPTWSLASRTGTVLIGTRGYSHLMRYEAALQSWIPSDEGLPEGGSPIAFNMGKKSVLASVISHEPSK